MIEPKTIGFIGFGLIGGSIARNLRAIYPDATIIAYNYRPEHTNPNLLLAVEDHVLNRLVTSFNDGFQNCDLIFLCAPVLRNISYLKELVSIIKPTCILTDVGSVKGNIHVSVKELGLETNFIGGHPMAGSEKTGYENSTIELLENAFYVLTPTPKTSQNALTFMEHLVKRIGAIPVVLPPGDHDDIVAAISHVPHIIAAALVNMVQDNDDTQEHMHALAAGGFKDITRIASSSPVMWENICLTNAKSIVSFTDKYISYLESMKQAILSKDNAFLMDFFTRSKTYRDSVPNKPVGAIEKVQQIHINVADKKGAIATIATILASHDVSIKNIGILHNREDCSGVLFIEFYDEASSLEARKVLSSYNYSIE